MASKLGMKAARVLSPQKRGTEYITQGKDDPAALAAMQDLSRGRNFSPQALKKIYHPSFIIDPRRSKYMAIWDVMIMVALLFTAIVTPVEVTFLDEGPCITILFVCNRLVDFLFMLDMCVSPVCRVLCAIFAVCQDALLLWLHSSHLPVMCVSAASADLRTVAFLLSRVSACLPLAPSSMQNHHFQPSLPGEFRCMDLLAKNDREEILPRLFRGRPHLHLALLDNCLCAGGGRGCLRPDTWSVTSQLE